MKPKEQSPLAPLPLIILFGIIILCSAAGGILYYRYQKEVLLEEKVKQLSAVTDLKIRQITQWRFERLADAKFIGENMMLARSIPGLDGREDEENSMKLLMRLLKSLTENYDYNSAALLDNKGFVRIVFPTDDYGRWKYDIALLSEISRKRRAALIDNNSDRADGVNFDVIVPLISYNPADTSALGFLALRIDPSKVLYPLLKLWPEESKSAETMVVRIDHDTIRCLSELRFPLGGEKLRTIRFGEKNGKVSGISGDRKSTTRGIDYRGVQVIAAMKKIPGTSWYLVSKIDRSEVFSELSRQMKMMFAILLLFIVTIALSLGFILWNQRVRYYRGKYEDELHRLALFTHFDYILKFANDIILLLDEDLNVVEVNDRAAEVYQQDREKLLGLNLEHLQAGETQEALGVHIRAVYDNGAATFETIHRNKDGGIFPIEVSARLVRIEGESYIQIIGRDITERKASEESLVESEQRFRKIFEDSPFPMVIMGKDFGIQRVNEAFCEMSGYTEEELMLHSPMELSHPDDAMDDNINLLKLTSGEITVYQAEKRYLKKDGNEILGASTISVVRNNRNEVQLFIGMIEDITQKKKAELELIAAKLKAEESDRLKTAFLHNVSHEIRTPMNAIIGFSSLLHEPDISEPDRHQYTDIIFQSSNQLLSIINDIVDVANIESGLVTVNVARTDLNKALRNLCDQYSKSKTGYDVPVRVTLGLPDEESVVMTDPTKFVQVISNLINNSLKFTQSGSVDFGYCRKDNILEFFVHDTGIGIPEESLHRIFDRFYQVDRTVSRQFGGTGLGLSICKAYVQLLGGDISVSSMPEKGTSFYFTIPYVEAV
jgi:PAS domain S-box-containing protein